MINYIYNQISYTKSILKKLLFVSGQTFIHLHFLVGNSFPPVFWLRLSNKITSCHTPFRCPNFSRYPTSLNPHFRCKLRLAIFSEIISAVIVQYFSFSDSSKTALSKAEPIPCLCFSFLTCDF